MQYVVEDSPTVDLNNGRKWRGAGKKFVIDRKNESYLSYLFKYEDREQMKTYQVFCFIYDNKSAFFNVSTSYVNGNWRKKIFFITDFTSYGYLRREFMRIGGFPKIYPAPSTLKNDEKILIILMAMRAFIKYGEIDYSPSDQEQGAAVYVQQSIDNTGLIPNNYLSSREIEEILGRHQDFGG